MDEFSYKDFILFFVVLILFRMLNIFVDYIKIIVYTVYYMEEMCNDNIRTD